MVNCPHLVQFLDTFRLFLGQGRLDGALCSYTEEKRQVFLKKAYDHGIRNIEMESLVFASMCNRANVRGCVICVVYVDRLVNDQITVSEEIKKEYERRPWELVLKYINKHLEVLS